MKPKAWLKSLNTNFRVMASRPAASLQPVSLPSASVRADPVSFWAISIPFAGAVAGILRPSGQHNRAGRVRFSHREAVSAMLESRHASRAETDVSPLQFAGSHEPR